MAQPSDPLSRAREMTSRRISARVFRRLTRAFSYSTQRGNLGAIMRPGIALEIRNSFLLGLLKNVVRKNPVVAYVMILIAVCVLCVAPAFAQQLATEPQVITSQAGVPPL